MQLGYSNIKGFFPTLLYRCNVAYLLMYLIKSLAVQPTFLVVWMYILFLLPEYICSSSEKSWNVCKSINRKVCFGKLCIIVYLWNKRNPLNLTSWVLQFFRGLPCWQQWIILFVTESGTSSDKSSTCQTRRCGPFSFFLLSSDLQWKDKKL